MATKEKTKKKGLPAGALSPKMRLFIAGSKADNATTFGDYAVKVAASNKLDIGIVKKLFTQVKSGGESIDREALGEVPKELVKKITTAFATIKDDYAKHVKNKEKFEAAELEAKEAAKAEKEAEKAAFEKQKQTAVALMDTSLVSTAKTLVSIKESVDATIEKFITPKIVVSKKTGLLIIKKDATLTEEDFTKSFAGFVNLNEMQGEFADKAAEREAQLALRAAEAFPETWELWFNDRPKDLARIKKGIKVYQTLEKIERTPFNTMANMRKALELKVENNNDAKNLAAKTELVDNIIAFQEKEDRKATQPEINTMREAVKAKFQGTEVYKKPKQVYLIQDKNGKGMLVSGPKDDQGLLAVQYISIDSDMKAHKVVNGQVVVTEIKEPTDKQMKIIQELIDELEVEDSKPAEGEKKPAKTKAEKKEKEPVEPDEGDDDEEEEDEDDDDADAEPVKAPAKGKKAAPAVEADEDADEEEEEEDEDDDEEDEDDSEDDSDDEDEDEDEDDDEEE